MQGIKKILIKIKRGIVLGLLLLVSIYFYSCKNNNHLSDDQSNNKPEMIDLEQTFNEKIPAKKLSDIASSIQYVKLETNDRCMFAHPFIEYVSENAFYIGDTHRHLYKFDKNGNYIREIGKIGKGPGEYLHITDVIVNPENNQIYILDNTQRKIIQYELNGEFQKELKLPLSTGSFSLMNDCFVLWNPPWGFVDMNYCYFLTFIDLNGKIVKHINRTNNNNDFRGGLVTTTDFYMVDKNIYIKDTYCDTVFQINSDYNVTPHFIISQGQLKMTRKMSEDIWLREKYMNDYISQLFFLETKRLMLYSFFIENYFLLIYDKQLKAFIHKTEGTSKKYATIRNDIDNGPAFSPFFTEKNKLFTLVASSELLVHWPETINNNVENIDEFSNPYVMIVELK